MDKTVFISLPIDEFQGILIDCINSCLKYNKNNQSTLCEEKSHVPIQEASKVLNLAIPTIYSKCSKGELPYFKKGKKLYFSKDELTKYLNSGKQLTNEEITKNVESYLKKGGNNG